MLRVPQLHDRARAKREGWGDREGEQEEPVNEKGKYKVGEM